MTTNPIQLRLSALEKRPALKAAVEAIGVRSKCGNFIEVCPRKFGEIQRANPEGMDQSIGQADRVELGLCGSHREKWAAAGRPLRSPEQVAALKAICSACDAKWRLYEKALCRTQPCTAAGRCAATYECPAGKWPAGS